jgi:hypothetical protein
LSGIALSIPQLRAALSQAISANARGSKSTISFIDCIFWGVYLRHFRRPIKSPIQNRNDQAHKKKKAILSNSTNCDISSIRSLPIDVIILAMEFLWVWNALDLCKAFKLPHRVAAQYFAFEEDYFYDLNFMLEDIILKTSSFKFMFKNKCACKNKRPYIILIFSSLC